MFNKSFGQNKATEVKEEIQQKNKETNALLSLPTIKNAEEIPEQKYTFKIPSPPICFPSASSPYVAMNWHGSPQTQCSFTTLNGISQPQVIFSSLSPLIISPKMDTFGDFEGFYANKNVSFVESPMNFCIPYYNGPSPNMAGAQFNLQPQTK